MSRSYQGEGDAKYQKLFQKYRKAFPANMGSVANDEVIKVWKETLDCGKDEV